MAKLVFTIDLRPPARRELDAMRAYDERRIKDSISANLIYEPLAETRLKKKLAELVPGFEFDPPLWQLSIGEYRVF